MKEALLYASTFIIEDNLMWFVPIRYNYLCCYNFTTEKVEKKFRLPEGNYYPRMHDNMLSYEGKLYLIPFNGSNVLIFDKMTESFQQISTAPFDSIKYKFCAATIYQNTLYMFPERVAAEIENPYVVIRVDLTREEDVQVVELDVPVAPAGKPYYEVFDRQYFVAEGFVYILLQRTNRVLKYSLEKNTTKIYEVGGCENRYATMYMDGDTFYLIDQDGDVTVWDKVEGIYKSDNTLRNIQVEDDKFNIAFSASFEYKDEIYFLPNYCNTFIVYNKYTRNIRKAHWGREEYLSPIDNISGISRLIHFSIVGNELLMWNFRSYKFCRVNLISREIREVYIFTYFNIDEMALLYSGNGGEYLEKKEEVMLGFQLNFFINNIVQRQKVGCACAISGIGHDIYRLCN